MLSTADLRIHLLEVALLKHDSYVLVMHIAIIILL